MNASGGLNGTSAADEQQAFNELRANLQLAFLQEFYDTIRNTCFEKCVTRPGTSLSSGEQKCLSLCFERYAEASQIVQESIISASDGL